MPIIKYYYVDSIHLHALWDSGTPEDELLLVHNTHIDTQHIYIRNILREFPCVKSSF
jgi:hypothetical protein